MTAKSYSMGHEVTFINNKWVFSDELTTISNNRKCVKCGELSTKEGYDPCLGFIEGVSSACCGHGVEEYYEVRIN